MPEEQKRHIDNLKRQAKYKERQQLERELLAAGRDVRLSTLTMAERNYLKSSLKQANDIEDQTG